MVAVWLWSSKGVWSRDSSQLLSKFLANEFETWHRNVFFKSTKMVQIRARDPLPINSIHRLTATRLGYLCGFSGQFWCLGARTGIVCCLWPKITVCHRPQCLYFVIETKGAAGTDFGPLKKRSYMKRVIWEDSWGGVFGLKVAHFAQNLMNLHNSKSFDNVWPVRFISATFPLNRVDLYG